MQISLSSPERARELARAFEAAGCEVERVGALAVFVPSHVPQADVTFFVRAWRRSHTTSRSYAENRSAIPCSKAYPAASVLPLTPSFR